eukprot:EC719694.1.p2 GENE.EC719694.1~~EC719694.1.p2  ORF type:complete len:100 (+),score=13.45 EC719694.1:69-368(+)
MPQNEHIELHRKRYGRKFDYEERKRKKEARQAHTRALYAQRIHGLRAKLYNKQRFQEKAEMRKTIAMHEERSNKHADDEKDSRRCSPRILARSRGGQPC